MLKKNTVIYIVLSILCCAVFVCAPAKQKTYADNTVNFEEGTQTIINPDCGFYKAFEGYLKPQSEASPVSERRIAEYADSFGLYHLRLGLEAFSSNAGGKDGEIDALALQGLKSTLEYLQKYKIGAIIRFSYNLSGDRDDNGKYLENEPNIELICKHIQALGCVISEYSNVVLGIESGMVGPWGEQHSTAIASSKPENAATYYKIVDAWLKYTPDKIGISVRRPLYFLYWINNEYDLSLKTSDLATLNCDNYPKAKRVGVYNDGYLGSASDLGTFTDREAETAFIGKQAEKTYYGGEVVKDADNGAIGAYNCVEFLEKEGFVTHTSYLNIDWNYDKVIAAWQNSVYDGVDEKYNGKTTDFEFVNNRLGYRLFVSQLKTPENLFVGQTNILKITLTNNGFARMLNKPVVEILLKSGNMQQIIACDADLTQVGSRESQTFALKFDVGADLGSSCEVYICLKTQYGRTIFLANSNDLPYSKELCGYKLGEFSLKTKPNKRDKFLVTFDANYGKVISGSTSQTVNKGESAIAPNVERQGYEFVGWDVDFSCVTEDLAVTAVWKKIEAEDSSIGNISSDGGDVTQGCDATLNSNFYLALLTAAGLFLTIKKEPK